MKLYLALCLLVGGVSALPWDYEDDGERSTQLTCNCGWVNRRRLVGGKETAVNEYPLIVSLERMKQHFCGGSIITPWHVLTAAHCTERLKPNDITVSVGGHVRNGQSHGRYKVAKIVDHEQYVNRYVINDISLLVLEKPIAFNQNVGPACLPRSRLNLTGQKMTAIGWGLLKEKGQPAPKLQHVDLTVISFEECRRIWAGRGLPQQATNVCTFEARKGQCQGDSGGPLIWLDPSTKRYTLSALVSYGGECAGDYPAVNTDIGSYVDWINRNIAATKPGNRVCTKA